MVFKTSRITRQVKNKKIAKKESSFKKKLNPKILSLNSNIIQNANKKRSFN